MALRDVGQRTFLALGTHNYRLFFAGQLVSVTGTWVQTTAQAWLILQLTHSPLMLGLLVTVQFLPVTLAGPFGGVVADRLPKRGVLIATQSAFAAAAAVLAALTWIGHPHPAVIFAVVFCFGVINVIDGPTRQAFVTEMVGRPQLPNAVALNSLAFNSARVVGPAVAGVLIGTVGVSLCFALNALSYVAVIVGLALIRSDLLHRPDRSRAVPAGVLRQLREGVAYVRQTPDIALAIGLMAVVSAFSLNFSIFLPALARTTLHVGASGFGLLSTALGAGALLGALGVAYRGRADWRPLLVGCAGLGLFMILAGRAPGLPLAMVWLALAGAGMITYSSMTNSLLQMRTPAHLRGRVMGLYLWIFLGTAPVGGLVTGAVEQAGGAPLAMTVGGLLALGTAAAGGAVLLRRRRPVASCAA
ncbi:MAG TPA: MFS transporter [Candidatus Micrarchaeia archaeon]|nr:MFS transporter [Candidatus Micrarchaeia archaeon]